MKLQIDTKAKTIKIDEAVKFEELIKVLNKLLPKEWKSYSLETGMVLYWPTYPVINYEKWNPQPLPYYTTSGDSITTSVYNVECVN